MYIEDNYTSGTRYTKSHPQTIHLLLQSVIGSLDQQHIPAHQEEPEPSQLIPFDAKEQWFYA